MRPNILFIFPDQLSARWMPCYGGEVVSTPYLDRFAQQSVVFTRAYTSSPLCTPYRACLLTGKYPSETGVVRNGTGLPSGEATLADRLNELGYATHYIGKWHLSGEPQCNRWVPPESRAGFTRFTGWESHHIDHRQGLIWQDDPDHPIALGAHETDGLTDILCDRLREIAASGGPFFMAVSYQAPHPPCSPPDEFCRRYADLDLDGPPSTRADAWFKNVAWDADYGVEEFRRRYFGEISHLDRAFGGVLALLDETGLGEDTIVVFTSDHGEMAGCHGLFGKGVMFDESVRVPLLVRMSREQGGLVTDYPVSTVDLFPTILELCGADDIPATRGQSFADLLRTGVAPEAGRDLFIEYHEDCIVRGDTKLVTEKDGAEAKYLFDLAEDPFEMSNLVSSAEGREVQRLLDSLEEWRSRVRDS